VEILLGAVSSGLLLGMVIALVALGLTIVFGVMDIVNFAHGEFLMLGMYTGLLTAQFTGVDPLFTLPVAALVGFLLGMACYSGFVKFLLARACGCPSSSDVRSHALPEKPGSSHFRVRGQSPPPRHPRGQEL